MKNHKISRSSLRGLARKIIEKILAGGKAQEILNKFIERSHLSSEDRKLCVDLVYGFLRLSIKLEFLLKLFLKKFEKLPLGMRILLGLGLYSLFFQDKIPAYAAVNETVNEIKKAYGPGLAKVANGVLRKLQKLEQKPYDPEWYLSQSTDRLRGYALFYSLPESILHLWLDAYGEEITLKLLARSAQRPWQALRINARHEKAAELRRFFSELPLSEAVGKWGWAFPPGASPTAVLGKSLEEWVRLGAISLQSAASILIMEELGLTELHAPIWDCCAGSGIKSAALLERGAKVVLATDPSMERLENIKPFCQRLNLACPNLAQASAILPPLKNWSGHIIADVPCSGLGELSRRPDLRLRLFEAKFWEKHVDLQKKIMKSLAGILEVGKKLVYMTCTLNPYENELLIQEILKLCPSLELEKEWQSPHSHPWLEGMYGAILTKNKSGKNSSS